MSLEAFTLFSLLLFCIGLYAALSRRNLIAILIGIELMLNAASLNALAFNPDGRSFTSGGEDGYVRIHPLDNSYFEIP